MKSSKHFLFHKSRPLKLRQLPAVYRILFKAFGHQRWWPGDSSFEIVIGAILTQNTAWINVEKAIHNLKRSDKLTPKALHEIPTKELAALIRPAGYFNIKADRLKHFIHFLFQNYDGEILKMKREDGTSLRQKLLAVKGIGPETADSILLYALEKPFFVIDAYTKRIFTRHRLQMLSSHGNDNDSYTYEQWQTAFTRALPKDAAFYNDFHAQIVRLGKDFCKPSNPRCETCPLQKFL